jgi:hypothetical protein
MDKELSLLDYGPSGMARHYQEHHKGQNMRRCTCKNKKDLRMADWLHRCIQQNLLAL